MTFMPDLASSAARMPPAAPTPTMTTSVFAMAMALAPPRVVGARLQTDDRRAREGLAALHVGRREHGLGAREADLPPAREVAVAAIDRVGEHALHGVGAHRVEEGLRGRPDEAGGLALLERADRSPAERRRRRGAQGRCSGARPPRLRPACRAPPATAAP